MTNRRNKLPATAAATIVACAASLAAQSDASACGGCFAPPESNTVVTDHRMILSVSPGQTTLYDQIEYSGSPESFAWVLPISGEATVGLSADVMFGALDGLTTLQVIPPPRNCPPPPNCPGNARNAQDAGLAAPSAGGGVVVNKQETVGPYETVQLSATDPAALNAWLARNGFNVPADVAPVIAKYVGEKFDFLAMKLVPGTNVQAMRPVRVTTKGASVVLPLRMVAAGTGPVVGITLWVVGEGRYEPQNFPSFVIGEDELIWDWNASASNYTTLRAAKTAASQGRGWELQSSTDVPRGAIENSIRFGGNSNVGPGGAPPDPDYLPITADGGVTQTADTVRDADLAALWSGIRSSQARITRLRADLDHAALVSDLVMTAPPNQATLSRARQVRREANQPQCPVFTGCQPTGTLPRDEAAEQAAASQPGGDRVSASCASSPRSDGASPIVAGVGIGAFLGMVVIGARRRRR